MRFDGGTVDKAVIERMNSRLERRGPDDAGIHIDGGTGFGHRRLSVIDLSARSHQPMIDEELDLVLVFNGAIYNYRELRAELRAKGYSFFSDGDTEVILKAYREWGERCPEYLHGMFAFVIWDRRKQRCFMARDRFGIKPLYYALDDRRLRFASNTRALLAAGDINTAIDAEALHFQFALHAVVPAPRTVISGIRKLEPGHSMTVNADGSSVLRRYWHLEARRPQKTMSEDD
jgi:asparagine synthase (glutamine-hydrolysing)